MHPGNVISTILTEHQVDLESIDRWIDRWRATASAAINDEPLLLANEAALSDEDSSSVLVYERVSGGAQQQSPPKLAEAIATNMRIQLTDIPGFGWWSRHTAGLQQGKLKLSMTGLRFPDETHKEGFLKLSQEHALYCWDEEPDTLIYSCGNVAGFAESELDIENGDLVFVMGCTDEAAVQKHLEDPKHEALGYVLYDAGVRLTPTFSKSYQTLGDGFFHKPST